MSEPLHVRRFGRSDGPNLVFLHGWAGTSKDAEWFGRPLTDQVSVWAFDLPGHGQTPLSEPVSVEAFGDRVLRTIDAHRIAAPVLYGYSLGGRVALSLALSQPARFRALVLESASPGIEGRRPRAARAALDAERSARLERLGLTAFLQEWYRAPLFGLDDDGVSERVRRRESAHGPSLALVLRQLSPGRTAEAWSRLSAFDAPLLYVHGERDAKYERVGARVRSTRPTTEIVSVTGAAHDVRADAPAELSEAVAGWISRLPAQN